MALTIEQVQHIFNLMAEYHTNSFENSRNKDNGSQGDICLSIQNSKYITIAEKTNEMNEMNQKDREFPFIKSLSNEQSRCFLELFNQFIRAVHLDPHQEWGCDGKTITRPELIRFINSLRKDMKDIYIEKKVNPLTHTFRKLRFPSSVKRRAAADDDEFQEKRSKAFTM